MEPIEVRPESWPKKCSSGAVIEVSTTSGEAPGRLVTTWMVGKSTLGSAATGRLR